MSATLHTAYIAVGANMDQRHQTISAAVRLLHEHADIVVTQLSLLREYDPVGGPLQDPYINGALELQTTLTPEALLAALHTIEQSLGRRREQERQRWGPRVIDMDLLLYDDCIIHDARLTIPHPRMHERRFVLEPLSEIAPMVQHPQLHQSITQLLRGLCVLFDR